MAEAVVDHLEVVEIHEHDGDDAVLAPRTCQRMADALAEQRAVGELGDGIVERLVGRAAPRRRALAHVAAVEDDPADVLVVEQVRVQDLEVAGGAVAVDERALDRLLAVAEGGVLGEHLLQALRSDGRDELVEAPAGDLVGRVAEQPLDRRALVGDRCRLARRR